MTYRTSAPRGLVALGAVLVVLAGCSPAPAARLPASPAATPAGKPQAAPGACGGTAVEMGGAPPTWARAGFSGGGVGEPPRAMGSPPDAVAYLFATQLVAGGQRPDGSSNKVLWVTRDPAQELTIEGRPLGRSQPVVPIRGRTVYGNQLPSEVDVPTPGCWSFVVSWSSGSRRTSTIQLEVLPAGTLPPRPSRSGSTSPTGALPGPGGSPRVS